jgi:threonine dehydratase
MNVEATSQSVVVDDQPALTAAEIEETKARLAGRISETPVHHWRGPDLEAIVGDRTQVILKLELFQLAGSFKLRGALNNVMQLSPEELARGVTAVSSGNHAVATSYAARLMGTPAKVVMMRGANPFRMEQCRKHGAELVIADNVTQAFEIVAEIQEKEGRYFVHPFEGRRTALGSATLGLEFCRQAPDLDAVIIAIGGGGLCGGMSAATKIFSPGTKVYGVDPEGSDAMHRSFATGQVQSTVAPNTIADSLNAPYSAVFTLGLCRANVDGLVKVSDAEMRQAMKLLFEEMKLAVEPAAAAASAALFGPLRAELEGKRVGILVCGTNTDLDTFAGHLRAV